MLCFIIRTVHETGSSSYLETLDDTAFGVESPVEPKFTSHSDPASQWIEARGGPAYFADFTTYLIDTDKGVILDAEATRSHAQAVRKATCTKGVIHTCTN